MLAIVNPNAGAGKALATWNRIKSQIRDIVGPFTTIIAEDAESVRRHVGHALAHGETEFIAAGGDGTVNAVMTSIVQQATLETLSKAKLGAVGLGSSNDFHKPRRRLNRIRRVPYKLNFDRTVQHDVCLVIYRDRNKRLRNRYWVVNASIGTTAEANYFFNTGSKVLRFFQRVSPGRGILYATLRTLARYRARKMTITVDDTETIYTHVQNLGIVKNPNFAGGLRYDSRYEPSNGRVDIHLLRGMSILRLLLALWRLARGKFVGQPGAQSWRASRINIKADQPFALEGDGEVTLASEAHVSVSPRLLQVCT